MSRIGLSSRSIRRSKPQIFEDVLRVIESGEYKPTRIMYKSNLSWKPLNKILNNMINLGLIEEKDLNGHKYFFITEKGKEFLDSEAQNSHKLRETLLLFSRQDMNE